MKLLIDNQEIIKENQIMQKEQSEVNDYNNMKCYHKLVIIIIILII